MNILKEAEKAGFFVSGDVIRLGRTECAYEVNELVKLIINQCISQIVKVSDRHTDQYIDAALRDAVWEIEEHFDL